jgi:DNA primase
MSDILDDVMDYLDGATRYSRYVASLCPFHNDSRPSFFVYPDYYSCRSCNAHGRTSNLINDIKQQKGETVLVHKHVDFNSPWFAWKKYGSLDNVLNISHNNIIKTYKTAYLTKRGITEDTIKELHIGWLDDWITFPIYDLSHQLVGAIARAGETNKTTAKYCCYPDQSPDLLYVPSWDNIPTSDVFYVVYGILDIITLHQIGLSGASTTTGKRTNPDALDTIRKRIYIIPDHGEELEGLKLASNLDWRGKMLQIDWPEGTKDINDIYCKYGANKLLELIGETR